MKRLFTILLTTLVSASIANAQCSSTPNNFEIKLAQTGEQTLTVQMRYHADAVAGASKIAPNTKQMLDGLVFGISWPTTSNVKLIECASANAPFAVAFDESIPSTANKQTQDNIKTLFHDNRFTVPTAFAKEWNADQWMTIATISFSGKLTNGDYFSLLNCDYGLAHPNSYVGNSTTDPWFAMIDEAGNYNQYSPKMITEMPVGFVNSFNVYPIPTSGDLTLDVECTTNTSAAVKVLDRTGRLVKTVVFTLEKGKNTNQINIGELPAGDYMIQLTDGKALNFTKKVTKI